MFVQNRIHLPHHKASLTKQLDFLGKRGQKTAMIGGSPERKGSGASAEEKNEDDCDVDTTRALAADCKRVEFEGDTRSLRFGLVQKTVRPFGKVVKATINPPDEGWLLLKTAEMAAKVAHTMENPRFVEAADGVDATWVCTFKEGEPVPDPYAKKRSPSRSRSRTRGRSRSRSRGRRSYSRSRSSSNDRDRRPRY